MHTDKQTFVESFPKNNGRKFAQMIASDTAWPAKMTDERLNLLAESYLARPATRDRVLGAAVAAGLIAVTADGWIKF